MILCVCVCGRDKLHKTFAALDRDQSGRVSKSEFKAWLESSDKKKQKRKNSKRADLDRGTVSWDEFRQMEENRSLEGEKLREIFDQLDKDQSGAISRQKWKKYQKNKQKYDLLC